MQKKPPKSQKRQEIDKKNDHLRWFFAIFRQFSVVFRAIFIRERQKMQRGIQSLAQMAGLPNKPVFWEPK
jgi:deoxyadenosine/deoxycytidine kinase